MPEKINITINGLKLKAEEGDTILQVAQRYDIYIPRYCYHPALSVAGNCRICLVEIEKNPKLQIACATPVAEGMVIYTDSERVKKARQDVLEFLLLNHPLDCPICDQVGECYLQDYYMEYGLKKSRVDYNDKIKKRKRVDLGKIVLDNERCILCTRCVRFLEEITKTNELFVNSRGDRSYIDIKPGTKIENNYSLNLVDICPVGALTSKDFRFKKRVYLLKTVKSICTSCSTGCKIKVQFDEIENKIYRILPEPNIYTNTWICDIGRFSYHELYNLDREKSRINGEPIKNKEIFRRYASFFSQIIDSKKKICVILSNYLSLEDNMAMYYLGFKLFETPYINFIKVMDRKIEDGILINCDKSPNSYGLEKISKKYNINEFKRIEADVYIGFEKEINILKINPNQAVVFAYKNLNDYPNIISIPTYFENEGSFINWQGYLRKSSKVVQPSENLIDVYSFVKNVLSLCGIYIDDKKDLENEIKRVIDFKEEG